jgi:hypothetical protein
MSCSSVTKEDKYSKHGKKSGENGKTKGRKNKVNDSKPDRNHEVDLTAGSDLEMDSRILSALLTVCGFCRSLYLFILFWYGNQFLLLSQYMFILLSSLDCTHFVHDPCL